MTPTRSQHFPLHAAAAGRSVRLCTVTGDCATRSHIASLGFVPGAVFQIVSASTRGPLLIALKSGRLLVDHLTARNIWVEPSFFCAPEVRGS
jgi:Fe2+ transport system protein FeoA